MTHSIPRGATAFLLFMAATAPAAAQVPPAASTVPADARAEEIVVTAQRTGIPVWRVTGPRTTIVLVGSIGGVAPGTKWSPAPLDAALAKADRVMFPEKVGVRNYGAFSLLGALGKWRKQATLPKGQTLQAMTTPAQWARLVALRDRGVLKPGFERRHPYHLAFALGRTARSKVKPAPGADAYVGRFLRKNKAKRVPEPQLDFKALTADFFRLPPRVHVPCLMDAVAQAEAGAAGVRARANRFAASSAAWAARRVPEALADRDDFRDRPCWPNDSRFDKAWEASLGPTVRGLMNKPQVTLAVMSLDTLADPGGVLDDLVAAGFDVRGPRWKR